MTVGVGNTNIVRAPFPKGSDSPVMLIIPLADQAGATTKTLATFTLPFAAKILFAEWYADVFTDNDVGNDYVLKVADDGTSTDQKFWINQTGLGASYAAGSMVRRALTVDPNVEIFSPAIISVIATGEATDVLTRGVLVLWLHPTK